MAATDQTLPKVYFISLGCFKNTVDSEEMLWQLAQEGFTFTEDPVEAGVIIVNTCGFIDAAKEESIDVILNAAQLKTGHPKPQLVVVGCLVERYRVELLELIPEIDLFLDLRQEERVGQALKKLLGRSSTGSGAKTDRGRIGITPPHISFLKIAEGCSRHCTFCTIPAIRGAFRSRGIDELINEACRLESAGVRELNIISQDTVSFRDNLEYGLEDLLQNLLAKTKIPWIRLLYLNPAGFSERLIDIIAGENRLLGYVDLPIQHISDHVLKNMGRKSRRTDIETLITKLRNRIPDVTLRTTVMVGFPGEEEEHFSELIDFIDQVRFDRLGVFAYSNEEGTPASRLGGHIAEEEKEERCVQVMELQNRISLEMCRARIGERTTILVDGPVETPVIDDGRGPVVKSESGFEYVGRSKREAYDVDGLIYLSGDYRKGEFAVVKVVDAAEYDLFAEPD